MNPTTTSVAVGTDVTLFAFARSNAGTGTPIGYQWRKNEANIAGANTTTLSLTNVQISDAGNYDVVASNIYGVATSSTATLTVFVPAIAATLGSPAYDVNNQFQFTVTGSAGSNYVVQVATNLSSPTMWLSLFTNVSPFTFVDSNAQNFPQRFYRALAR